MVTSETILGTSLNFQASGPVNFIYLYLITLCVCLIYILIETARDEKESVKVTFVLSVTFSTCSCLEALRNMSVNCTPSQMTQMSRLIIQVTFNFVS